MIKSIRITIVLAIALGSTSLFGLNSSTNLPETSAPKPFAVEIIGQGKPILYLPGFATPGSIWIETVKNLDVERKSYLFSYAGFAGVEAIETPWYSTLKYSIIEYIKDNNMSDIIIVGHSMGGNLAIEIASELPDKVSKIILVESLPCMRDVMMPGVPAESLTYDSPYNKQMLEMEETQFKNMAAMMASNMTFNAEKADIIANWIIEADRKTWVYGYTDLLKLDLRSILGDVKCETLIIGASFPDVEIAKANYEKQYAGLSNKTVIMASDSKHFLMFDQPDWFYETVNAFLGNERE